jgi:hypothetical protein
VKHRGAFFIRLGGGIAKDLRCVTFRKNTPQAPRFRYVCENLDLRAVVCVMEAKRLGKVSCEVSVVVRVCASPAYSNRSRPG